MCQNRWMFRIAESIMITTISKFAAWPRPYCDEEHVTANRHVSKCRLIWDERWPVFYPCLKSCALHPESSGGTSPVGSPMIQFVSLGDSALAWPSDCLYCVRRALLTASESVVVGLLISPLRSRDVLSRSPRIAFVSASIITSTLICGSPKPSRMAA